MGSGSGYEGWGMGSGSGHRTRSWAWDQGQDTRGGAWDQVLGSSAGGAWDRKARGRVDAGSIPQCDKVFFPSHFLVQTHDVRTTPVCNDMHQHLHAR